MIGGPRDYTFFKIALTAASFFAAMVLIAGGFRLVTWLLHGEAERIGIAIVSVLGTIALGGVVVYANHLRNTAYDKVLRSKLGSSTLDEHRPTD